MILRSKFARRNFLPFAKRCPTQRFARVELRACLKPGSLTDRDVHGVYNDQAREPRVIGQLGGVDTTSQSHLIS